MLLLSGYSSSGVNNGLQVDIFLPSHETEWLPQAVCGRGPNCHLISSEESRIVSTAGNGHPLCNLARFLACTSIVKTNVLDQKRLQSILFHRGRQWFPVR